MTVLPYIILWTAIRDLIKSLRTRDKKKQNSRLRMLLRCRRRSIISRFPKCWTVHFSNFEHRTSGIYHEEDLSKKESYKPLVLPCHSDRLSGTRRLLGKGREHNWNKNEARLLLSFRSSFWKDTKSHLEVIYYVFEINEISRVSNEFRTVYSTEKPVCRYFLLFFCFAFSRVSGCIAANTILINKNFKFKKMTESVHTCVGYALWCLRWQLFPFFGKPLCKKK